MRLTRNCFPIKNPELKAFVQKVGPAFQAHLDAAKKLAQKYGATT